MNKILIVTSEPENYVPVKLKEAGTKNNVEVEIALTENFCYCYVDNKVEIKYFDAENNKELNLEEFGVVIPRLNDDQLKLKEGLLKELEQKIKMLNSSKGMIECQEKLLTEKMLSDGGFKTPKTKVVLNAVSIKQDDFNFPVIVKTNTGSQGIGVLKADSYASLKSIVQLLCEKQIDFLIQEYIEHDHSYRIITLGDNVLAANKRHVAKDDFRTNSHQNGVIVKNTEKHDVAETEIEMAKKVSALLGCQFCAIDYLMGEDGVITILEVNGSPGLEAIQEDHPDKDLANEVVKYCVGLMGGQPSVEEPAPAPEVPVSAEDEEEEQKEPAPEETETERDDSKDDDKEFVSEFENVVIKRINDDKPIEGKVDTGADSCSLHGENIEINEDDSVVKFEYGETVYRVPIKRTVNIVKAENEKIKRAVIQLDVIFRDKEYKDVEMTVADRSELQYEFLIGKNLLAEHDEPVKIEKSEEE